MNDKHLAQIESTLKITLPSEYRELILDRAEELKTYECFQHNLASLFMDSNDIVRTNKEERRDDSGTCASFPGWLNTFVLIGTNGGGDYYCLRLDHQPGIWMIGSDCGHKPTRVSRTFKSFVDKLVKEFQQQQAQDLKRQIVLQNELAVEAQSASSSDNPNARKWVESESAYLMFQMLEELGHTISPRKMRLFGLACCQKIKILSSDEDCVRAVQLAVQMVDGTAASDEVARHRDHLERKYRTMIKDSKAAESGGVWCICALKDLLQNDDDYLKEESIRVGRSELSNVWNHAISASRGTGVRAQSDLFREVLGNPFHPVSFQSEWRTDAVLKLAQSIVDCQEFKKLSSLAKELVKAGCDDQRILEHCHRKTGHVRGCWVLDLILGQTKRG